MNLSWVVPSVVLAAAAFSAEALPATTAIEPSYRIESSIPLSDGFWDLVSFDAAHNRVIVARAGAVSLVDIAHGESHDIGQVARGHAALMISGTDKIAVTSGQDDTLRLLDTKDGHQIASVMVGKDPDAALWDPGLGKVVVMNARGGSVSLVDPASAKVVRTIPVKPALELAAIIGPGMLAINDEDAGELELVDLKQGKALAPIALTGCEGPTGLAYDPAAHLSLSACANGVAALVNVSTKKVMKLLPIGQGPDTALFDAKRQRFLVPCGRSGTLSVFSVHGDKVDPVGVVPTEAGARTAALDPTTGRVFLPAARFQPAAQGQRPAMVPGSAHLLVLAPN